MGTTQQYESLIMTVRDGQIPLEDRHEAFGELVRSFQDMAYGYAYATVGDTYLAEEAAQEAFITAYRKLQQLRNPAAFPGWLRQIVHTQCHRLIRGKRVPTLPITESVDLPSTMPGPPDVLEEQELQAQIMAAVQALPDQQRQAIVLVYIDGYSQSEVAEFLEVPVTTLRKRLQRARAQLRERIFDMVRDNLQQNRPSGDERFVQSIQLALALETVAMESQQSLLELLLVDGMNVNGLDLNGQAPLHWAVRHGHREAVELLLENGADPELRDAQGRTPLEIAEERGDPEILGLLRRQSRPTPPP